MCVCVCIFIIINNNVFLLTDKICFINNFHFSHVFLIQISFGNLQSKLDYNNVFITTPVILLVIF